MGLFAGNDDERPSLEAVSSEPQEGLSGLFPLSSGTFPGQEYIQGRGNGNTDWQGQMASVFTEKSRSNGDDKLGPRVSELEEVFADVRREQERLLQSTLGRVSRLVEVPVTLEQGLGEVLTELREVSNAFNGQHRSISELFEALETSIQYCQQRVEKLLNEVGGPAKATASLTLESSEVPDLSVASG